ncbi:unnamed protein product [Musa hybrid cultivar]
MAHQTDLNKVGREAFGLLEEYLRRRGPPPPPPRSNTHQYYNYAPPKNVLHSVRDPKEFDGVLIVTRRVPWRNHGQNHYFRIIFLCSSPRLRRSSWNKRKGLSQGHDTQPAMASKMVLDLFCFTVLVLCMANPSLEQEIFDPMDFEAMGDGETDDGQALVDAWDSACEHRAPAIFVIPNRTFLAGPATFEGPCRVTPKVQILGTVKAVPSMNDYYNPGWFEFKHLNGLEIGGGGTLDGQGAASWNKTNCPPKRSCKSLPISMRLLRVSNATIANLTFMNSKGFHIGLQQSSSVTISRLRISAPADSPNTDGIHISRSDNVMLTSLNIGTGDDCISIGQGVNNLQISDVTCGPGHGISVGSLGKYMNEEDVSGVSVRNCTVSGTTNGVRIKTWPGSPPSQASNFTFEDIIMHNVSNPIIIDQHYCPDHDCVVSPSRVKIQNVTFRRIQGTSNDPVAVKLMCSETMACENVQLQDISLIMENNTATSNITSSCSNVKGVAVGLQNPESCLY